MHRSASTRTAAATVRPGKSAGKTKPWRTLCPRTAAKDNTYQQKESTTWKTGKRKVSFAALTRRLAALALAAALALGVCAAIAPAASAPTEPAPAPSVTQGEGLTAHFIDVGQALSVLVECEGHYLLYDGGNVPDGELVVSYLQNLGVQNWIMCSAPTPTRTMWAAWRLCWRLFPPIVCTAR